MTITIADGRGALWQWDTGRRVRVDDNSVKQVHYQNRCFGRSVDVDVGTDGTAIIPDELLQDWHTLTAYAYAADDTGAYTMVQQDFAVHKRAKPAGYVYTPTDQMTLQTIQRQIGDLADLTTTAKDTLVAAINEALTKGGGEVDQAAVQKIVEDYLKANPPIPVKAGNGLKIAKDGILSVDTADKAEKDNTKPITSASVYLEIGNINALLATI